MILYFLMSSVDLYVTPLYTARRHCNTRFDRRVSRQRLPECRPQYLIRAIGTCDISMGMVGILQQNDFY